MDGLSLLCNLHSDGPLALRRLRAAGVHDLGALEGVPEATLIECLRSSAGHARRFLAEARQLTLRLVESPLEPEPASEQGGFFPSPPERDPDVAQLSWRTRPRVQEAPLPGLRHPLRPGVIAGLDERTCERLLAHGVHSLDALHERASLELARTAGIPFVRLLDLATRARHALTRGSGEPAERELVPESPRPFPPFVPRSLGGPSVSPSARASRAYAADPGTAGPFG